MGTQEADLAGQRVLIIEDESMITMFLEDVLADLGYRVAGIASRYSDALAKVKELAFDVAVLDVNLDGECSFPIAEALLERGKPFLFSTGYGEMIIPPALRSAPTLQKPFEQRDLARALRAALKAA